MKHLVQLCRKVAWLGLGLLLVGGLPARAAEPGLKISPATVQIGAFFNGQTVTVSGTIPAGAQAVLEVMGSSAEEHLMRKGRRGGLWMNVGEIKVQDAPSLYLVMSTAKELLTAAPPSATWGYRALEKRIAFSGKIEPAERQEFLKQFLELKESEHIYASRPGALKVEAGSGGASPVTASFPVPTNIRPGTYKICLSVIADGKAVSKTCTDLTVEMVGFPALMAQLAYQHGAAYGVLAVVLAIVVGFAMGFLFKGGGGH
jgi:Putative transmembrane protein (Alph_Pro_TM)